MVIKPVSEDRSSSSSRCVVNLALPVIRIGSHALDTFVS